MDKQSSQTPNVKHVAIIMDGNGRWARRRGLPRSLGHKRGAEAARRIVKYAAEAGIDYITLFGFSSENWRRPNDEIEELMTILRFYLRSEMAELHKNNACLRVIGARGAFDDDIVEMIEAAENLTADNTGITVVIALNYGGRADILQAVQKLLASGDDVSEEMLEKVFESSLMTTGIPDPDLLIRTSGEMRISNFLLWQSAYTEFVFTDALWPDFDKKDFDKALKEFAARERRFGGLAQSSKGAL